MLEVELAKRKIPFVKYGGLRFLEAAHIKDLLAVLRWADNPRNTLAAFRALQLLPGMGPVNARAAIEQLEAGGYSFAALKGFAPPQTAEIDWRRLIELLQALADPQRPWQGQVNRRASGTGRTSSASTSTSTRGSAISTSSSTSPASTPRASASSPSSRSILPTPPATCPGRPTLDEDYLVLSTIHSAKGMEWDTVYVLNVVDGSFPSEFATGKPELIEEERRLLYVALTRAQNELLLIAPLKFHLTHQSRQGDAHVYGGRSRFLSEKVLKTLDAVAFQGVAAGSDEPGARERAGHRRRRRAAARDVVERPLLRAA